MNKNLWRTQTAAISSPNGLAGRRTDWVPQFRFGRVKENLPVEVPKTAYRSTMVVE